MSGDDGIFIADDSGGTWWIPRASIRYIRWRDDPKNKHVKFVGAQIQVMPDQMVIVKGLEDVERLHRWCMLGTER